MDTNDGNECPSVSNESNEQHDTTTDNETQPHESSVAPTSGPVTIPDQADSAGPPISGPATIPDRAEVDGTPTSGPANVPPTTESPTVGPASIPDCDDQIRVPKRP